MPTGLNSSAAPVYLTDGLAAAEAKSPALGHHRKAQAITGFAAKVGASTASTLHCTCLAPGRRRPQHDARLRWLGLSRRAAGCRCLPCATWRASSTCCCWTLTACLWCARSCCSRRGSTSMQAASSGGCAGAALSEQCSETGRQSQHSNSTRSRSPGCCPPAAAAHFSSQPSEATWRPHLLAGLTSG